MQNLCDNCLYCFEKCICTKKKTRLDLPENKEITSCAFYEKRIIKTNGDRIRSMTDEQLAEFIANDCLEISDKICNGCPQTDYSKCGEKACTDYIKKWLQSESEG